VSPDYVSIADILDFFNDSVEQGTLVGSGPGNSGQGHLYALLNELVIAKKLIVEDVCTQLNIAYERTDGDPDPKDYVSGDATEDLAGKIQELMDNLGCEAQE
jgi:hypothetical protein